MGYHGIIHEWLAAHDLETDLKTKTKQKQKHKKGVVEREQEI